MTAKAKRPRREPPTMATESQLAEFRDLLGQLQAHHQPRSPKVHRYCPTERIADLYALLGLTPSPTERMRVTVDLPPVPPTESKP